MKPSDRINELTRLAAEEAMRLEGTEDPKRAEQLLEDHRILHVAVVAYLDEEFEQERN